MDPIFDDLVDRLEAMHRAIEKALDGLPDEALDWTPGPEMNSLAVLLAHTLGAERYWIGDVAGLEPSSRDRSAEFVTRGRSVASFVAQSQDVLSHSRAVLSRLSLATLAEGRTAPLFGQQVSTGWAVFHALEHTALHAGHIEITRQLWDQRREKSQ